MNEFKSALEVFNRRWKGYSYAASIIRKALTSHGELDWLPIDSAPTDGTPIIMVDKDSKIVEFGVYDCKYGQFAKIY